MGSIGMMMSALVRQDSLSDEDIKELQAILKAAEEKQRTVNKEEKQWKVFWLGFLNHHY